MPAKGITNRSRFDRAASTLALAGTTASHLDLATALGQSLGWVKKWLKRLGEALTALGGRASERSDIGLNYLAFLLQTSPFIGTGTIVY